MVRPRKEGGPEEVRPGGKQGTSFRLTPEARDLIAALAAQKGITQSAVVELAVRDLAKREGLALTAA